ncbi:tetratricopeptide repeat protein [Armatimonas rosea]|uniref:Tetratricopeptide (TPR) repeat protein n=1 Tax=Armatimonas rosea TaxID=685828 RepID=A0A7W9SUG4_ARMRO|nr:tetratricopeptide repeat protein [Armatimonas rosea]MBB6052258.1 tetratricopeptide (TPR) repeat protein [Armatimonas rosea]
MKRQKNLFVLLGVLLVGGLASLPWQLRQWKSLEAERQKTAFQEKRLRELSQASQKTSEARTHLPTDPASRMEAALALVKTGDSTHALPLLHALEEDSHRIPGITSPLGDLYRQVGQVDRAYALLSSALLLTPNDPATLVRMAYLELSLGEREAAMEHIHKAQAAAPNDPEPYLAEAFYQDQESKFALAEPLLKKALAAAPERWNTAALLADNQARQGRYDQALESLDRLVAEHPGETQILAQQARTLLDAANAQSSKASEYRKKATEVLETAQKLAPGDASLPFERGRAWRDLGETAKARQAWEESYRLKPTYAKLRGQLGALLLRTGEIERGRRLIAEEEQAERERTDYNVAVGKVMQARGDEQARRQFAHWCATHQKPARAILEWERLLSAHPNDPEATQELARLKNNGME